ncbi:sigma-70 family RNA polymerase sigma factor [Patescibacteria group bacterium]|nr:MAG: sigma-70 family RNA polymerase sigma factor [Patescibacteria group bacterium]
MNEEEVIVQAKTDPEAFGRLYDAYYQPIFGFLYKRTGNAEAAKDLASETFFQALKNIRRYELRGKPFKSWLFAIAAAQAGTYFRGKARAFPVTSEECPEVAASDLYRPDVSAVVDEDVVDLKRQAGVVRRLLTKLNQKQQTILNLRFFSGQTVPEISATLGMKEGTIKSHIHRALNKLRGLVVAEEKRTQPDTYVRQGNAHARATAHPHRV